MYKYSLRYIFSVEYKKEGFTKKDANGKHGLCDSIINISILQPPDGSYSQAVFSYGGKDGNSLTQEEIFKAWIMLGISLHDEGKLKGWRKEFVEIQTAGLRDIFSHKDDCTVMEKSEK